MKQVIKSSTKQKYGWLERPKSGKRTSAILWIATFIIGFALPVLVILLNYILATKDKDIFLDTSILTNWVDFIEVWVYGLIWFSGFIVMGTTAKEMLNRPKEEADKFLNELSENRSQSTNYAPYMSPDHINLDQNIIQQENQDKNVNYRESGPPNLFGKQEKGSKKK